MSPEARKLHILSVEDEPETIAGPISFLQFEGHEVTCIESVEDAKAALLGKRFDLLIVDQRLAREGDLDYEGGSRLVTELKQGDLGELNREAPFVFVTASSSWISERDLADLSGYLGVELKAGDLSRRLRETIDRLSQRD